MNKEIKEILRDLEFASGVFDYTITPDRCTFLKDYITNLQQEIERLNNLFEYNMQTLVNTDKLYEDYKSRCEKAKNKLSFIDEALENDTLNVPLCITKINSALNILQNGSEKDE